LAPIDLDILVSSAGAEDVAAGSSPYSCCARTSPVLRAGLLPSVSAPILRHSMMEADAAISTVHHTPPGEALVITPGA
jgi:hypothetical protein